MFVSVFVTRHFLGHSAGKYLDTTGLADHHGNGVKRI